MTGAARQIRGARDAGARPRRHRGDGSLPYLIDRRHAAIRLEDERSCADAERGDTLLEEPEIPRHHRADVRVHDRRRQPFELAELRQHVGRDREVETGELAAHQVGHRALVRRVHVRVQEADRERFHALRDERADRRARRVEIEPLRRATVGERPLGNFSPEIAPHDRLGRVRLKIVEIVADLASQLEEVAHALRGDEPGACALPLEHRVDADRRSVTEKGHGGRRDAVSIRERGQPDHDADRLVGRGRRNFFETHRSGRLVESGEIGERAADVNSDAPGHRASLARITSTG